MSLDVDALQKEIETLRGERSAAEERISFYSHRGRGRGRGRGFVGGRSPYQNGRPQDRDRPETTEPDQDQSEPSHRKAAGLSAGLQARLGGRSSYGDRNDRSDRDDKGDMDNRPKFFGGSRDGHDHRVGRAAWKRRADNSYDRDEQEAVPSDEPLPGSNTGRLASAVVTDASQPVEEVTARRPVENGSGNPEAKKRNKRLFGSLLGTLQKFQEEDQRFKRSRLAQNRAEAETRAAEKAVLEEERMKEQHKQDLAKARVAEINKKKELDLQLQAKRHEMMMAKKIAYEMKHIGWLKTAAGPPLLWLPARHNENTSLLLEQRHIDLEAWKDDQLARLEKHTESIMDRFKPVPQPMPRPSRVQAEEQDEKMTELKEEEPEEGMIVEPVTDRFEEDGGLDEDDIAIEVKQEEQGGVQAEEVGGGQ